MNVRVAVIGAGYWGKNLVRNFSAMENVKVAYVCDRDAAVRTRLQADYATPAFVENPSDVLQDKTVDAVVVATETPSHYEIARHALNAGKHVYIEKPMAQTSAEAEELVLLADKNNVKLMTGHLLMYHPAFEYVKNLIDDGALGKIYYLYSTRVNLGIIRTEENAFESLAPHDLSIALWYLGGTPTAVSATGASYLQKGIYDVVFATVYFDDGRIAHLHTSWLDPHKTRSVTVVGDKKMAVIDDVANTEKVRLYDKGVNIIPGEKRHAEYTQAMNIRSGDIQIPHIPSGEPLARECRHFIDCIVNDSAPLSDGRNGLAVVRILEAGVESLKRNGEVVELR